MDFVIENGVLQKYTGRGGAVVIPDGVVEIKESVFMGWGIITEVTIPATVRSIGMLAFYDCTDLSRITMSVETLEANGDFWEAIFGGTGKTLELVLLQEGKEPYRCISGFRKSSSAEWDYKRDYVVPLTEADLPVYDRLVATGEFQGIRMNEQGRMKAMIWRFAEKDRPIDPECRAMFVDFLAGKFSKLIKLAEAEKEPGLVRGALEAGVVTDANKKKITNALKKSTVSQIKALADQLDTIAKN